MTVLAFCLFATCQTPSEKLESLQVEGQRHALKELRKDSSQSVVVDSTSIGPQFRPESGLQVEQSSIPRIIGLANADMLNGQFLDFLENTLSSAQRTEETLDTLDFVKFDFRQLYASTSVLSIQCRAFFWSNGGNMWWMEHRSFNIDLRSGSFLSIPDNVLFQDLERLDAIIMRHFDNHGGCLSPYYCHSCENEDYLQEGKEQNHIGIVNGQWTLFEFLRPKHCSHAAKSMFSVPLESL